MEIRPERDLIIHLATKMDNLSENVSRLAGVVERLETTKFEHLGERVTRLEKFKNQWGGALMAFNIIVVLISVYVALKK